ncbi:pyroglutamyl-peptidase I [Fervidobacterium pennivorans subsp. shakshaketiis]|uniref:Pyroglutamyl-peptidase I n=1 Tax=Fervidobacterium pennivorans (strain DSM 9078 / Ven5) TaxID=771875 RepID=H9UCI2_FERPD|nr:pyroglutamyl-peptidase I [Fervidobacterium pennivorans]AFG35225.1 pyroglutamyl-peptidase I [Fervidobacterium pennivorans DSM 9078]QIV78410.1 pyroglutamyl-peptidase I [Fervidobacterium pennivorans subsp. keratinolyticus]
MDSGNRKQTILLTGFEPFGGEKVNPSMQIVKRLSKRHFQNIHIETLILPVSYEKSTKVLEEYYKDHHVDFVLHLGQAGGTSGIRIERVAINLLDSRHPDNDGVIKRETPILENGPDGYMTRINVREIANFLNSKKIPAFVSYTAGQYICNEVYYYSLHHSKTFGIPKHVLFIHLPFLPEQVASKEGKTENIPSMSLELQTKAIRLLLENIERFI